MITPTETLTLMMVMVIELSISGITPETPGTLPTQFTMEVRALGTHPLFKETILLTTPLMTKPT